MLVGPERSNSSLDGWLTRKTQASCAVSHSRPTDPLTRFFRNLSKRLFHVLKVNPEDSLVIGKLFRRHGHAQGVDHTD